MNIVFTYENMSVGKFDREEDYIASNAMEPIDIKCSECDYVYKTKLEFNQSNFFD